MPQHRPTTRRRVLGLLGCAVSGASFAGGVGSAAGRPADAFVFEQDDRCGPVAPIRGEQSAAAFYDWDEAATKYSSDGTTELQRDDTSLLFLYESPTGVFLVIVHGRLDGSVDGGSASFTIEGLPESGSWVVRDDYYDGPSNYDRWRLQGDRIGIDWTWARGRTDGGVFGPLGDAFDFTVYPAFDDAAALDGQYYNGDVVDWQVLSATPTGGVERRSLELDRSVRLRTGGCSGGPGDGPGTGPPGTDEPSTDDPSTDEPGSDDPMNDGPLPIGVEVRQRTVNPSARGVVPVDLRSTASVPVRRLVLDTARAGPAQAPPVRVSRVPGHDDRIRAFFSVPALGLVAGDTVLRVTAETADGEPVAGAGAVRVHNQPGNRRERGDDGAAGRGDSDEQGRERGDDGADGAAGRGDSDGRGRGRGKGRDDGRGDSDGRGRGRDKGRSNNAKGSKEDDTARDERQGREHRRDDDREDDDEREREDDREDDDGDADE